MLTISAEEYHAGRPDTAPALSSSIAKLLLNRSPRHAWLEHQRLNPDYQPEVKAAFDLGTAAHAMLLEGKDKMKVLDYPDWRTKAAQNDRDDARAAGLIPVLPDQHKDIKAMHKAALEAITENVDLGYTLADGKAEQTIFWQEGETECKLRLDWVSDDCKLILDYKTTDIKSPDAWMRSIPAQGYDIQAAWYLRGLRKYSEIPANFAFMVQEVNPPFPVYFVGMSPAYLEIGNAKVEAALKIWRECMKADVWPTYSNHIMYPDPTGWAMVDAEEKIAISKDWSPADFMYGRVPGKKR